MPVAYLILRTAAAQRRAITCVNHPHARAVAPAHPRCATRVTRVSAQHVHAADPGVADARQHLLRRERATPHDRPEREHVRRGPAMSPGARGGPGTGPDQDRHRGQVEREPEAAGRASKARTATPRPAPAPESAAPTRGARRRDHRRPALARVAARRSPPARPVRRSIARSIAASSLSQSRGPVMPSPGSIRSARSSCTDSSAAS